MSAEPKPERDPKTDWRPRDIFCKVSFGTMRKVTTQITVTSVCDMSTSYRQRGCGMSEFVIDNAEFRKWAAGATVIRRGDQQ